MDFIIGMFLIIFGLIFILNFASLSITDKPQLMGECGATTPTEEGIGSTLFKNLFRVNNGRLPVTTSAAVVSRPIIPGSDYSTTFY